MSDPWKRVVRAAGGKPGGAALAQGLFVRVGLVAVLWYLSACMVLVGFEDYKEPGRAAAFWWLTGFLVLMVVCSLGAAAIRWRLAPSARVVALGATAIPGWGNGLPRRSGGPGRRRVPGERG